jgi:transposase
MNTLPTTRRSYDEQFKRDAVALLEGGRKAAQLARELGISGAVAAAVELAALQRELASLRRHNDILKKALAIIAQQEAGASSSFTPSSTAIRP